MVPNVEFFGNTVVVKNLPDVLRGCGVTPEDTSVHLGMLFERITACGRPMEGDILLADDVVVTCQDCVAEIIYRSKHSEAATHSFGVVTHRGS